MISIAVARGRLGSAVRTQLTLRIDERTTSKSEALYVLPEPKMPCTPESSVASLYTCKGG